MAMDKYKGGKMSYGSGGSKGGAPKKYYRTSTSAASKGGKMYKTSLKLTPKTNY